jgi:hypothetical protein
VSYCFMNYVYTDGENKLHEMVKFDDDETFNFEIFYCTEDQLIKLVSENKYILDFKILNNYLVWDGQPAMTLSSAELEKMSSKNLSYKEGIPSVYTLFSDLVDAHAQYIRTQAIEDLPTVPLEESVGTTSFSSLKCSKSTMSVYLSILEDDSWKVRSFVKVQDGFLSFTGFHFIVKQELASFFETKYNISEMGKVVYDGKNMSIFKVEPYDVIIYPHVTPNFVLCDPMLNHKVYSSEREKAAIDFIDHFVAATLRALSQDQVEEYMKAEKKDYVPREDSRYNVLLDFKGHLPNRADRIDMLSNCINIYDAYLRQGWDAGVAYSALSKYNYGSIKMYCCLVVLKAISSEKESLDKIQHAQAMKSRMKLTKLKTDLELFSYRAILFSEIHRLPFDTITYLISGGKSEYPTEIYKKLKDR